MMENIIKKAIEGGWEAFGNCSKNCVTPAEFYVENENRIIFHEPDYPDEGIAVYTPSQIVCDPEFWQALGKVCKWQKNQTSAHYRRFMKVNYYNSFEKAVEWLSELTLSK